MIHRVLFYGLFLVAAGVLPYLSSEWSKASRSASGEDTSASNVVNNASAPSTPTTSEGSFPSVGAALPQRDRPQSEVPVVDLAQAIRFDATPSSLFRRWPRVVTGLPDGALQGYRVPLMTGTREDDVAGSLTYYFNSQLVCQKITLQASVGDPRKITAHVLGRFGLLPQTSDDPGVQLYQTRWNGKPVSELKIKPAPVVKASAPSARYVVEMVLKSWPRR